MCASFIGRFELIAEGIKKEAGNWDVKEGNATQAIR